MTEQKTEDLIWQFALLIGVFVVILLPNFCFKVDEKEFQRVQNEYNNQKANKQD